MDIGQWIVIILSAVLGVWYFIGAIINRRRGMQVFNWLRPGMESTGKLSEARWIGSSGSGARLVVTQAQAPFRRLEAIFLLESREILPLWLFNHLRGKRDEIIIKASLRSAPTQELEAARKGEREFQKVVSSDLKKPFELTQSLPGYDIARRGKQNNPGFEQFTAFLQANHPAVWRVSVQRQAPHVIVRANIPDLQKLPAEEFFGSISELVSGSADGA